MGGGDFASKLRKRQKRRGEREKWRVGGGGDGREVRKGGKEGEREEERGGREAGKEEGKEDWGREKSVLAGTCRYSSVQLTWCSCCTMSR